MSFKKVPSRQLRIAARISLAFSSICTQAHAADNITAYFFNDSVNGFQYSDAYETHNMGILYSGSDYFVKVDLGIVSPDMWIYRNRFREANRSFGEIISVEFGQTPEDDRYAFYGAYTVSGDFGIDKLQDFAHEFLSLQPVNEINDLVRMPDQAWFGIGTRIRKNQHIPFLGTGEMEADMYVGTDSAKATIAMGKSHTAGLIPLEYNVGLKAVIYDNIVSSEPIGATERRFIPFASLGVSFEFMGYDVFVREVISLPTISSDNDIYARLNAGIAFSF